MGWYHFFVPLFEIYISLFQDQYELSNGRGNEDGENQIPARCHYPWGLQEPIRDSDGIYGERVLGENSSHSQNVMAAEIPGYSWEGLGYEFPT